MREEYGFDELEEDLEASNYFERDGESFEGKNDEALRFNGEFVEYCDALYLEDEVSRLVEELEQDVEGFSRASDAVQNTDEKLREASIL